MVVVVCFVAFLLTCSLLAFLGLFSLLFFVCARFAVISNEKETRARQSQIETRIFVNGKI